MEQHPAVAECHSVSPCAKHLTRLQLRAIGISEGSPSSQAASCRHPIAHLTPKLPTVEKLYQQHEQCAFALDQATVCAQGNWHSCSQPLPFIMFSDSSSNDSNVCVIKRSLFDHPERPFQTYLGEFVREVCGSTALKDFSCYQAVESGVAACVWCPPFLTLEFEVRSRPLAAFGARISAAMLN